MGDFLCLLGRYDVDLLKLRWMAGGYDSLDNPVVDKRLSASLPSLGVDTKYFVGGCEIKDANRGTFSCLRYFITFYRYFHQGVTGAVTPCFHFVSQHFKFHGLQ